MTQRQTGKSPLVVYLKQANFQKQAETEKKGVREKKKFQVSKQRLKKQEQNTSMNSWKSLATTQRQSGQELSLFPSVQFVRAVIRGVQMSGGAGKVT